MQVDAVPLQAPPHPAKPVPEPLGVSVSVTCVPLGKLPLQVVGQLIPVGELVMVPEPLVATVSCMFCPTGVGELARPRQPIANVMASSEMSNRNRRVPDTGAHSMNFSQAAL